MRQRQTKSIEAIKTDTHSLAKQLKKVKKAEGWASKVKVKGDIRLRYQWQDTDGGIERNRGVIEHDWVLVNPWIITSAVIASGGDDPRSTTALSTTPLKPKMPNGLCLSPI